MSLRRDLILWTSILAGPTAWLISFEANFALVPWTCIWQGKAALYLVSFVAFVVSGLSGWLAWREWKAVGSQISAERESTFSRIRTLAIGGVSLSLLSCLIIAAQAIPELVLGACQ